MDDEIVTSIIGVLLVLAFLTFMLGLWIGNPDELENGCIIHGDSVYCKESNE